MSYQWPVYALMSRALTVSDFRRPETVFETNTNAAIESSIVNIGEAISHWGGAGLFTGIL